MDDVDTIERLPMAIDAAAALRHPDATRIPPRALPVDREGPIPRGRSIVAVYAKLAEMVLDAYRVGITRQFHDKVFPGIDVSANEEYKYATRAASLLMIDLIRATTIWNKNDRIGAFVAHVTDAHSRTISEFAPRNPSAYT